MLESCREVSGARDALGHRSPDDPLPNRRAERNHLLPAARRLRNIVGMSLRSPTPTRMDESFVKSSLKRGYSAAEITMQLRCRGWERDVAKSFVERIANPANE